MIALAGCMATLRKRLRNDAGFTLIELLVSMGLFAILATILFTTVISGTNTLTGVRQSTDLNEESRLVLNRMSRELRQAQSIFSVVNPNGASCFNGGATCSDVRVTFDVDFNGDGAIQTSTVTDPERLTYHYDGANKRLLLEATGFSQPILGGNVTFFKITYLSSNYKCDANSDGVVTWQELDSAPTPCPRLAGNNDGVLNDELAFVDQITIDLSVLTGSRQQDYQTTVDLRNNTKGTSG